MFACIHGRRRKQGALFLHQSDTSRIACGRIRRGAVKQYYSGGEPWQRFLCPSRGIAHGAAEFIADLEEKRFALRQIMKHGMSKEEHTLPCWALDRMAVFQVRLSSLHGKKSIKD